MTTAAPLSALAAPAGSAPDLTARASRLRDEIERLRVAEGAALLDGGAVDTAARRAAADELEAVEAGLDERIRRERAAGAQAERERRADLRRQVGRLDAERRQAVADAEAGARAMVAALAKAEVLRSKEVGALGQLGAPVPTQLSVNEHAIRLGRCLSALLDTLNGPRGRFGELKLHAAWVRPEQGWLDFEAAVAADIANITKDQVNG